MDASAQDGGEIFEATAFLGYFEDLTDTRQPGKVVYPLDEVLLLALLATLAGAETVTDMARFGEKKLALLRRFRPFKDGTPPHDRIGDIFAALDADQFQHCFVAWVASVTGVPEGVIAIDGKTVRRSGHKKGDKAPIHMVSAFAARQRLVLGQVKVAEKSNEIIAIPKLLNMLAIDGAIVTIDAMGCQRTIAAAVLDKKADYVLALKGNQGSLREDVEVFVTEQRANGFADTDVSRHTTVDGDHGRIETRATTVIHDVGWLRERHDWPGLKAVVVVESSREVNGKTEHEMRLYLTSLVMVAALMGPVVRNHWAIENSLHWVLDMIFRDDECRVRTDHAPANFTTIKHMAHNLLRTASSNDSLRLRRKVAAWDDDFLAGLIAR
ncbi:ISAs1 family transposase [Acidisphaera sp. S103]|uniref:ISAs1 family transposase n=1 Tax=Acidisphaera sp. S103 TaxID=1747223 RepID=UPI001575871B|nr:ISAs1 family transposase [Acidisphaera sp. S103]